MATTQRIVVAALALVGLMYSWTYELGTGAGSGDSCVLVAQLDVDLRRLRRTCSWSPSMSSCSASVRFAVRGR